MTDRPDLSRLYVVTDRACARRGCGSVPGAVEAALAGGPAMIQFRDKAVSDAEAWEAARSVGRICDEQGARLLINRRPDFASLLDADGVHRPSDGLPVEAIRAVVGDALVAVSCHDRDELIGAQRAGADVATLSPVFPTDSKPGYGPPLGLETFAEWTGAVDLPIYALGGVTPRRAAACRDAGAFGAAAMSGVMAADDPRRAVERYLDALN